MPESVDTGPVGPSEGDPPDEIRLPWSRSERPLPRRVVRPVQEFLQTATASASLLFLAVVVALVWVNSPWRSGYEALFSTELSLQLGSLVDLEGDLHFWVNDGLMPLYFLVIGLEIKREVVSGELRRPRVAALPVVAAIVGMIVPALLYLAIAGTDAGRGWGIPMATDIAFALSVLTLAAAYAPPSLKPLLLTLAIVDDMGTIIVIAIFYTGGIALGPLLIAIVFVAMIALATTVHIRFLPVYAVLGAGLWYATYRAGINPTIAGVTLALLTPAAPFQRPAAVSHEARRTAEETSDDPDPVDADAPLWLRLAWLSREAVSPLARTEHALLPWASFVILPIFALANSGVELSMSRLSTAVTAPVAVGIFVARVFGKPLGVLLGSWLTVRSGIGHLSPDVGWGDITGMGATAGIGFAVALFIAELAFPPGLMLDEAKTAILAAALVAGIAGYTILRISPSPDAPARGDVGELPAGRPQ
jgi:NhaA family Na+:H+ antiporter